jgi:hypothetical protein
MVEAMMDGGKDLTKAANTMFKNLFKSGISDGLDQLKSLLIKGFRALFGEVGGAVGSAVMGVIGLVGMMLTSKANASYTPSNIETQVTTHEAVRGVIAGESSIPIAQISVSISEALNPHLNELRKIEANTRKSGAGVGASGLNFNLIVEGLSDTFKTWLDQYFSDYLVQGAKG